MKHLFIPLHLSGRGDALIHTNPLKSDFFKASYDVNFLKRPSDVRGDKHRIVTVHMYSINIRKMWPYLMLMTVSFSNESKQVGTRCELFQRVFKQGLSRKWTAL